jgi:DNA polymerase III sliding clamp (beta) subunit (PCNA family)
MSIDTNTTAETTTAETTTAGTIMAPVLVAALAAVIPHASTDVTLPFLRSVRFETSADQTTLTVVATNRYTLGSYRLAWDGGPVAASIDLDDAKALLAYAKKASKHIPLALTFGEEQVDAFDFSRRVEYRYLSEAFPAWNMLIPSIDRKSVNYIGRIGFNPAYLAMFAKAADKQEPMILTFGDTPTKSVRVDIGDNFTGLIMPVRIVE